MQKNFQGGDPMSDTFGLKLAIENEKEFKVSLQEINQSFKVLASEMKLVASQFDKQDQGMAAVTARNATLTNQIDLQREKVSLLGTALSKATESFGENDRRTQNWTIQLNKAQAELFKMERQLTENNKTLAETNEAMKLDTDIANSINDINNSFKLLGSEMELVASQFDKTDRSAEALTAKNNVLSKQIGLQSQKVEELKTALANSSEAFGANDERTQSWAAQLNQATAKLNNLERELESNNEAIKEQEENLGDAERAAEDFGNELDDTGEKVSIFGDVLLANLAS